MLTSDLPRIVPLKLCKITPIAYLHKTCRPIFMLIWNVNHQKSSVCNIKLNHVHCTINV